MVEQPRYLSNRYEMGDLLGAGGMAEVYDGYDRVLARRVAIKVLYPQYTRNPAFVARFKREAQAAASLAHPNVVGVYDTGEHENTHFTVMEYVEGKTLATLIEEQGGPLPFDQVVRIAMDVCSALAAAHARGLIHRDVKPANIMVTPRGQVKVMDFGIARAISAAGPSLTETAGVVGTARYMSPEQAQAGQVDERSDIYSLGVTLYECLTGQVPFDGDSPVAVAARHISEAPRPPGELVPQLPPALEAITLKALAKDPTHRYQSAEELRDDLGRAINGEPVNAGTPENPTGVFAAGAFGAAPVGQPGQGPPAMGVPTGTGTFGNFNPGVSGTYGPEGMFSPGASGTYGPGTFGTQGGDQRGGTYGGAQAFGAAGAPGFQYDYAQTGTGSAVDGEVPGAPVPYEELEEPRRRFRPIHLIGIAGAMLLLFAAVAFALPRDDEQAPTGGLAGGQGVVPDVRGQTEAAARQALAAVGLRAEDESLQEADDEIPRGSVIKTEPRAGSTVVQGDPIVLIVSTGPRGVEVPDLIGQPLDEAQAAAEGAGFQVRTREQPSDGPAGLVVTQDPEPGSRVRQPGDLLLVVSVPEEPATTNPPPTTVPPTTVPPTTVPPTTAPPATDPPPPATEPEPEPEPEPPPAEDPPPDEDPPADEEPPPEEEPPPGGGGDPDSDSPAPDSNLISTQP